jgi:hypothetical protein
LSEQSTDNGNTSQKGYFIAVFRFLIFDKAAKGQGLSIVKPDGSSNGSAGNIRVAILVCLIGIRDIRSNFRGYLSTLGDPWDNIQSDTEFNGLEAGCLMFSNSCDDGEILGSLTSMDALFPLSVSIDGCARIFALFWTSIRRSTAKRSSGMCFITGRFNSLRKSLRSFPLTPSSKTCEAVE